MIDRALTFLEKPNFDNMTTPNDEKTRGNHFSLNIPSELRPEFEEMVARENATRMVYGFIVAGLAQLAFLWQDWQRLQQGMFEQHPPTVGFFTTT